MARTGTILTMGGGGFSTEPENPLLDDFLLSLATRRRGAGGLPKVCFVPTASGDAESYVDRFVEAFAGRAETSSLRLFHLSELAEQGEEVDLRAVVLAQDVIYVGGGSTANLLAVWRLHGLDEILAEAAEQGVVLAGISAGMNCWYESSVTDSFGPLAGLPDGLGFLAGSACPHYDGEAEAHVRRTSSWSAPWCRRRGTPPRTAARCSSATASSSRRSESRPDARAFRVHLSGDGLDVLDGVEAPDVAESPVDVRYLG